MFESNYNLNVSNIPINHTWHAKNYFPTKKIKAIIINIQVIELLYIYTYSFMQVKWHLI